MASKSLRKRPRNKQRPAAVIAAWIMCGGLIFAAIVTAFATVLIGGINASARDVRTPLVAAAGEKPPEKDIDEIEALNIEARADLERKLGHYPEAEKLLRKILKFYLVRGRLKEVAEIRSALANILVRQNKPDEAQLVLANK